MKSLFQGETMSIKNKLLYAASVAVCFLAGCVIALILRAYDARDAAPVPITGGQTIDFSAYGFTLTVPDGYSLNDYTANNLNEGGSALFAGCAYEEGSELYIFCYQNESGDRLDAYDEQEVVSYYISAGCDEVRTRTFGGRRFICYRASLQTESGMETWDTYETWDESIQISFETRMAPADVLPILATITFTPLAGA